MTANASILERIAAGESGAVAECLDRYGALVWSLVRARLHNTTEAEDVAQEIFIEVWKNAARFRPQMASEVVFVAMIARRRLVDRLRALGRQTLIEPIDPELPLFAALEQRDQYVNAADVVRAARAVNELDAAQRNVVLLGVVQGLSHAEIAAASGKPLGTVKTQLRRALLQVSESMAHGVEEGVE